MKHFDRLTHFKVEEFFLLAKIFEINKTGLNPLSSSDQLTFDTIPII